MSVVQTGEEGLFYQVRAGSGIGFVPKLYLSAFPPGDKVNFGTSIDKSTSVRARARASNFSQTAAARGLSESQKLRTRGGLQDFDFDSISWIESLQIAPEDLRRFQTEGEKLTTEKPRVDEGPQEKPESKKQ